MLGCWGGGGLDEEVSVRVGVWGGLGGMGLGMVVGEGSRGGGLELEILSKNKSSLGLIFWKSEIFEDKSK